MAEELVSMGWDILKMGHSGGPSSDAETVAQLFPNQGEKS
jgi:hypothetical protein